MTDNQNMNKTSMVLFIQDSKQNDWNVSEKLSLCLFVCLFGFFKPAFGIWNIDERASKQEIR